jgi:Fe-S cluster assembly protein SufD
MAETTNKSMATKRLTELFETNRQTIDKESAGILNACRQDALEAFKVQGIPGFKSENYKYTDLTKIFESENFRRVFNYEQAEVDIHEVFRCDVPELNTHLILLVNGWYYQGYQKLGGFPEGVIVKSLKDAATENAELVEKFYGKFANHDKDPLVALNTAYAQDGVFIYVPDNVIIEKPIQIINLLRGNDDLYATQRNLLIAGRNSQARILFCDHSLTPQNFIANNITEVEVGENAVIDVYSVQNQHNKTVNLNGLFAHQGKNSAFLTNTITLHGGVVRNNLSVLLDGEHAEANIFGLSLTDREQHVDNFTFIEHKKPNCRSNQVYKNVLDDNSSGGFTGRMHVMPGAGKTEAFQRNNNVLLTKKARMNTKPQLVIDNDDVKCSHGATVGQIDNEALFYLKARGIAEREARLMLMFAFAHEVLQKINVEPLREQIDNLVDKRLRGEVSQCHSCVLECDIH